MTTFLIALTPAIALLVIPLAVIAAGIRRQEHAASLSAPAPGIAAALTRKLLAVHAAPATSTTPPAQAARPEPSPSPARRPATRPAVTTVQARP
jgi:hypothetical protein